MYNLPNQRAEDQRQAKERLAHLPTYLPDERQAKERLAKVAVGTVAVGESPPLSDDRLGTSLRFELSPFLF